MGNKWREKANEKQTFLKMYNYRFTVNEKIIVFEIMKMDCQHK